MPFIALSRTDFSDLVYHELDPSVGYARQDLNITPPAAGAEVLMGTIVFRAKAGANTAETPYAALSAAADISADNEYAVVYGDHYQCKGEFVPRAIAAGQYNAVGFVGKNGALMLKDYLIKPIAQDADGADLTDAQFENLREVLASQGIIVEVTL